MDNVLLTDYLCLSNNNLELDIKSFQLEVAVGNVHYYSNDDNLSSKLYTLFSSSHINIFLTVSYSLRELITS